TTSWDRTDYFEQLPSNQVELALWLEADRMGTLLDAMDQAKLHNQREVVKNERRQSIDNQPYGTWLEKMGEALFHADHPYRHPRRTGAGASDLRWLQGAVGQRQPRPGRYVARGRDWQRPLLASIRCPGAPTTSRHQRQRYQPRARRRRGHDRVHRDGQAGKQ